MKYVHCISGLKISEILMQFTFVYSIFPVTVPHFVPGQQEEDAFLFLSFVLMELPIVQWFVLQFVTIQYITAMCNQLLMPFLLTLPKYTSGSCTFFVIFVVIFQHSVFSVNCSNCLSGNIVDDLLSFIQLITSMSTTMTTSFSCLFSFTNECHLNSLVHNCHHHQYQIVAYPPGKWIAKLQKLHSMTALTVTCSSCI